MAPAASFHASSASPFILRTLEDIHGAGNVFVGKTGSWESRRYLLRKDGLGFSFHYTIIREGVYNDWKVVSTSSVVV